METKYNKEIQKRYEECKWFQEDVFSMQTYSREQMIKFAMYCSGHGEHMIEFRFEEFNNKSLFTFKK